MKPPRSGIGCFGDCGGELPPKPPGLGGFSVSGAKVIGEVCSSSISGMAARDEASASCRGDMLHSGLSAGRRIGLLDGPASDGSPHFPPHPGVSVDCSVGSSFSGLLIKPNVGISLGFSSVSGVGAPHGSELAGGGERMGDVEMGNVMGFSFLGVSPQPEPDAHGSSILPDRVCVGCVVCTNMECNAA